MDRVGNITRIAQEFIWTDGIGLTTKELGQSVGSEKFYVNLDVVAPNKFSTKYHTHYEQEEFFYILSGRGKLRLNDVEIIVEQGSFLSKPAGKDDAHTFQNIGTENLLILDIGTREQEDICSYPDEDVHLYKTAEHSLVYQGTFLLEEWTSDPNSDLK